MGIPTAITLSILTPRDWQLRQTFHDGKSESTLIDPADNRQKTLEYYDDGRGFRVATGRG